MKLKVGLYLGDIKEGMSGVQSYALRLASALHQHASLQSAFEFEVIGNVENAPWPQQPAPSNHLLRKALFHLYDSLYLLRHPTYPFRRAPVGELFFGMLNQAKYDLIHFPSAFPPRLAFRCPFVVTMHDVQELHFPENFSGETRFSRSMGNLRSIRQANAVVVSFEHVKHDLVRFFDVSPDRIYVIPVPFDECPLPKPTPSDTAKFEAKFNGLGEYFLYPASTWAHKNHLGLLEGFELLCERVARPLRLVCTGQKTDFFSVIEDKLRDSTVSDKVDFLGVVSDGELRWLYEHSAGVVIPTLYEAGSFPLMEAIQLGVPVICANTTSLPITIGTAEFVFDPRNPQAMSDSMFRLITDNDFRARNIAHCKYRKADLQGQPIAKMYEDMWRKICDRAHPGDSTKI
jgi:glycosyltransferase involved in cell wall biosynthesis